METKNLRQGPTWVEERKPWRCVLEQNGIELAHIRFSNNIKYAARGGCDGIEYEFALEPKNEYDFALRVRNLSAGSDAAIIKIFESVFRCGALIMMSDGRKLQLQSKSVVGRLWNVIDESGNVLMSIHERNGLASRTGTVDSTPTIANDRELRLICLIAWYAIQVCDARESEPTLIWWPVSG